MGCDVEVNETLSPDNDVLTRLQLILPDLKSRVLEGCHIVFSGVIPRHIRPEE